MNLKELARKAVSTLFLSMLCLVAFAQTATGLVKDKTGEPMIGVNVLVKGTTNGTITDFDGKFSIPDVPSNATLVVSYIGYLTKEVKNAKLTKINKKLTFDLRYCINGSGFGRR